MKMWREYYRLGLGAADLGFGRARMGLKVWGMRARMSWYCLDGGGGFGGLRPW